MDKTAIKNYAVWARVQLIESSKQRAFEYGITEDGENRINVDSIDGRILTAEEKEQRRQLIEQINQKGYSQVMEEAAYTWFNRFIALRFMEVNGYLPSKVRVFTDEGNNFKPEILKEAMTIDLDGIDRAKVADLLEKQDNEGLYKYLLITQCNALSSGLPYMFETISNWTELLFPANLLRNDSVIGQMICSIYEEDWTDQVQIIGWLYQYYNSELKDETFALLKKNVKITKERIPAATQLFTPDWIVRYMVENSLGRLWYEGHRDFDKSDWKYYLDEAEQEPEVEERLVKIREEYSKIRPEEIKAIDPCMGSGHILVYMFDVLMQIYASAGWSERDAAKSILENNLYGLDIDDRAGQLAYFAVMMKARKYSRRIMSLGIEPNVMSIQGSSFMTKELIDFVAGNDSEIKRDLIQLKETFTDAKEYGSILDVPSLRYVIILDRINEIKNADIEDVFQIQYKKIIIDRLLPLVKQAKIISQKYDVVVTNPPYMGSSGMSAKLGTFVKKYYPDSKSDLFAVFIERASQMVSALGFNSMVTMQSWMFLSSFEVLRNKLIKNKQIITLMHMENMVMHIAFGTVVTVLRNNHVSGYKGTYNQIKLKDIIDAEEECPHSFPINENRFSQISTDQFKKIPGSPIAYWLSKNVFAAFQKGRMEQICIPRMGLTTGQNEKYLRLWFEVMLDNIGFNCDRETARQSGCKWFPYNKAGDYRKWYGNRNYVVNWQNDGYELQNTMHPDGHRIWAHNFNLDYNFKEHISWNDITSGNSSFRLYERGFLFDAAAAVVFVPQEKIKTILGFLNTKFTNELTKVLNPTIHFKLGDFCNLPYEEWNNQDIDSLVDNNIRISKSDWNSFETSWDFKKHPLI